jgi:hypothetical protein
MLLLLLGMLEKFDNLSQVRWIAYNEAGLLRRIGME